MNGLFEDFKPSTKEAWKQQVLKDLKGELYENLCWHNDNGFTLEPYYTAADLKHTYSPAFASAKWKICVKCNGDNSAEKNKKLLFGLSSGADSIAFDSTGTEVFAICNEVVTSSIESLHFVDTAGLDKHLQAFTKHNGSEGTPDARFFPVAMTQSDALTTWLNTAQKSGIVAFDRFLCADVLSYHNLNCFDYYEIALALSMLNEFLHAAQHQLNKTVTMSVRIGVNSDYFVQIAKLRALRRLFAQVAGEYNLKGTLHIVAETSLTNKTLSDQNNNLLRTSVEGMAAVIGGCDTLIVNESDILLGASNYTATRLAINQQLVLREETYIDKMADVACGSYFIETLTDELAHKALEAFKKIEDDGGYFTSLEKGLIHSQISAQSAARGAVLKSGKQQVIGVTRYRNEKENMDVPPAEVNHIMTLKINNPSLDFEMENFIMPRHA